MCCRSCSFSPRLCRFTGDSTKVSFSRLCRFRYNFTDHLLPLALFSLPKLFQPRLLYAYRLSLSLLSWNSFPSLFSQTNLASTGLRSRSRCGFALEFVSLSVTVSGPRTSGNLVSFRFHSPEEERDRLFVVFAGSFGYSYPTGEIIANPWASAENPHVAPFDQDFYLRSSTFSFEL